MTVRELIEVLQKAPQDLPVRYYWDGCPRSDVLQVYRGLSYGDWGKEDSIILCDEPECYHDPVKEDGWQLL